MRIIIIALALFAAWYYFQDKSFHFGTPSLINVEDTAAGLWSALPRPGKKAEQDLRDERQRSETLGTELLQLRETLARASAEAAARETALQDARDALKTHEDRELSNVANAEALGTQLAAARQDAALRSEALRKTIGDVEARAAELSRDNGLLQQRLGDATTQIAADLKAKVSLEGELRAVRQEAQQQQEQSRGLASDLNRLRETSSSQIADLRGQLEKARIEGAAKTGATSTPPEESRPDVHRIGTSTEVADESSGTILPEPSPKLARDALADGVRTRVVVRFTSGNASAKARAVKLCSVLQAQGAVIEQIVGSPSILPADSIAYFYRSDESRAATIATIFPEFRSTMRQRPPGDRIPRPGLIEIEVAT